MKKPTPDQIEARLVDAESAYTEAVKRQRDAKREFAEALLEASELGMSYQTIANLFGFDDAGKPNRTKPRIAQLVQDARDARDGKRPRRRQR